MRVILLSLGDEPQQFFSRERKTSLGEVTQIQPNGDNNNNNNNNFTSHSSLARNTHYLHGEGVSVIIMTEADYNYDHGNTMLQSLRTKSSRRKASKHREEEEEVDPDPIEAMLMSSKEILLSSQEILKLQQEKWQPTMDTLAAQTSQIMQAAKSSLQETFDTAGDATIFWKKIAGSIPKRELECDYENNCTLLYECIENSKWDVVSNFLDTGYWPGSFFPDISTPSDQARTWVTRLERGPDDDDDDDDHRVGKKKKDDVPAKVMWRQLPLHLACFVDAPLAIVRRLVDLYPESIRCTDDEQMLPIHLALNYGARDEIVHFLLTAWPGSVNVRGKNGQSTLAWAIQTRDVTRAQSLAAIVRSYAERVADGRLAECPNRKALLHTAIRSRALMSSKPRDETNLGTPDSGWAFEEKKDDDDLAMGFDKMRNSHRALGANEALATRHDSWSNSASRDVHDYESVSRQKGNRRNKYRVSVCRKSH